jgi:hypothetical protein
VFLARCAQCRVSCRGTGCVGAARLAGALLLPGRGCAYSVSGAVLAGGCAWERCGCRVCRGVGAVDLAGGGAVVLVFHGPVGVRKDAGAVRGERRVAYVEPAALEGGCC